MRRSFYSTSSIRVMDIQTLEGIILHQQNAMCNQTKNTNKHHNILVLEDLRLFPLLGSIQLNRKEVHRVHPGVCITLTPHLFVCWLYFVSTPPSAAPQFTLGLRLPVPLFLIPTVRRFELWRDSQKNMIYIRTDLIGLFAVFAQVTPDPTLD